MGSIALWTLGIRTCRPWASTSNHRRYIHQTPRTLLALSSGFESSVQPGWDTAGTNSRSVATRIKWSELMDSLSRDHPNPSRVWNIYLELGSVMGFYEVPFEIQQQVLQKCVPRAAQLRISAARRMRAGNNPKVPHIYETRLQTLIGHMRASGRKPQLEDYNFILEQFAAVGHHHGASQVFQELVYLGIVPSYRTYGHCLQAIAHRLTLPCPFRFRSNLMQEANKMCAELLDDMWRRRIPLTSVNFDLVLRVFKETSNRSTFERLISVGYGIDLANPDRPPLELQGPGILTGGKTVKGGEFTPLPFTTAALNTLIDMLGQTKQISRMVMAFEVFTTPIPPSISKPIVDQGYADEDDEDYQFSSPEAPSNYHPPAAAPNTTSFNLLIRYAAKANHAVFARHYVVQAMERDREVDARLRSDLVSKPLEKIVSPNFAVNRGTFLPPFGLANRTKHFAFMRWGWRQTALALDHKKEDLAFYSEWQRLRDSKTEPSDGAAAARVAPALAAATDLLSNSSDAQPSNAAAILPPTPAPPTPVASQLSEALFLDLDAPPPPAAPLQKPLDLGLHISLLTRDVEEINALVSRQREAVRRLSQRIKERLGRRVWQGKDIFLMHRNKRVHVDRGEWTGIVRFRNPRPDQMWHPTSAMSSRQDGRRVRHGAPHMHSQNSGRRAISEYAPS